MFTLIPHGFRFFYFYQLSFTETENWFSGQTFCGKTQRAPAAFKKLNQRFSIFPLQPSPNSAHEPTGTHTQDQQEELLFFKTSWTNVGLPLWLKGEVFIADNRFNPTWRLICFVANRFWWSCINKYNAGYPGLTRLHCVRKMSVWLQFCTFCSSEWNKLFNLWWFIKSFLETSWWKITLIS